MNEIALAVFMGYGKNWVYRYCGRREFCVGYVKRWEKTRAILPTCWRAKRMIDRISPHHRTLYILLNQELEHAPASAEMDGKCDWCGIDTPWSGNDYTAYSCNYCNQKRENHILRRLLDWEIGLAAIRPDLPVRSIDAVVEDCKQHWTAEIRKIIEESGGKQ